VYQLSRFLPLNNCTLLFALSPEDGVPGIPVKPDPRKADIDKNSIRIKAVCFLMAVGLNQ